MQQKISYLQVSIQAVLFPNLKRSLWLATGLTLFYLGYGGEVRSQIAPDGTLSTNVTTSDRLNFTINDGNRAGNNLFHSFREFSVPTGGEAFFNNAGDIQNIFSRVTGNSISNIDGLIRANGTANLFLINPNGIIFGPNARLNIGGSFLGSTASTIEFGDGIKFTATNPQAEPLLSINLPVGLQYGNNPGEIRVQGKGQEFRFEGVTESFESELNPLEVSLGKNLTLVGGNVIVDGGILQAPGGGVEIGGLAGEGTLGLNGDGSLSFPDGVARADVSIINQAGINVLAGGGGRIAVTARNIDISGESLLSAGIATNLGSAESIAGDIFLSATEATTIAYSRLENNVNPDAVGNSGNISISTNSLFGNNIAQIDVSTYGQGNAGSITIMASDTVSFYGEDGNLSGVFSSVLENAIGNAGEIAITAKSVFLTNNAGVSSSTFGQGNAGSVTIIASDTVTFDSVGREGLFGGGAYTAVIGEDAVGNAGGVSISAKEVSIINGAELSSTSRGKGAAGNIVVAADVINLNNEAFIATETIQGFNSTGQDQASIRLGTSFLTLRQGSRITTNAQGENIIGGNITINADVIAALGNSDISANSLNAKGGNVTINAQAIFGALSRTREELQTLLNTEDPTLLDPINLFTSDISATGADSSLSGTVAVNTPNVDPSSGLVTLPVNLVDNTRLITSTCRDRGTQQNQFVVMGKGGLPPSPNEALDGDATWVDLRGSGASESGKMSELPLKNSPILEAQGWTVNFKGEVELVVRSPNPTLHSSGLPQLLCNAP